MNCFMRTVFYDAMEGLPKNIMVLRRLVSARD